MYFIAKIQALHRGRIIPVREVHLPPTTTTAAIIIITKSTGGKIVEGVEQIYVLVGGALDLDLWARTFCNCNLALSPKPYHRTL